MRVAEKKRDLAGGELRGSYQFYMSLAYHLKQYSGDKILFKQIDKKYCMDFIEYMKTAKSRLNDKHLDETTQRQYVYQLHAKKDSEMGKPAAKQRGDKVFAGTRNGFGL
jgi:hypothetical protein